MTFPPCPDRHTLPTGQGRVGTPCPTPCPTLPKMDTLIEPLTRHILMTLPKIKPTLPTFGPDSKPTPCPPCPPPNRRGQGQGQGRGVLWVEVYGDPQPEPRPRARALPTKPKPTARVYVPKTAHEWKHKIRAAVVDVLGTDSPVPEPRPQAYAVAMAFRLARPKAHYGTGRNAGKLKPWARSLRHVSTPDLDNLIKAALDALGDWDGCPALVWCDDSQVVAFAGTPTKQYTGEGVPAGLTMAIVALDPPDVIGCGSE